MKKNYLKPDVEYIELEAEERIMSNLFDPSWGVGEDDEEGRE